MIVDAVMMDREWECLEIRLHELEGLVDRVVIVEGNLTHQGEPRELIDPGRLHGMFEGRRAKLVHIIAHLPEKPDDPALEPSLSRAIHQRNHILQGLDGVPPHAKVMISDIDEIPRREDFVKALAYMDGGYHCVAFEMGLFYYRLNLRCMLDPWYGPRMIHRAHLKLPHNLRLHYATDDDLVLRDSGWHFSWLGNAEAQMLKIQSFSHPELNTPEICNAELLDACRKSRTVIHNGASLEKIPIDYRSPILVNERPHHFRDLIEP